MHSIMWKGINTLLKALERYAILTARSFIYGAAVHWLVAMSMDVLTLAWK